MSRAFVWEKDVDYLEVLPERPISEHSNDVTETGLTQIEHALAAQTSIDRAALAAAGRDLSPLAKALFGKRVGDVV
jgi:transcription elongation GreA/GreB family factor